MSRFNIRLRELRESKSLSQQKLADMIGTSKSSINMYERGEREPGLEMQEALADYFNVDMDYLFGKSDIPRKNLLFQNQPSNIFPVEGEYVKVPVIGRVAAGLGCLADNEIIGYEYTDADDINGVEDYRFLRVVGDSMYPKIEDGDLLLVRSQTSVDSGSIAVVIIDDEDGVVKRVVYGKDFIELHSINPMYPVRRFENEDVLRVRVCGLVKQIKRKL